VGYRALTEGAALVRRSDRGVLAATGPDRLTWLQGLLTNDVASLDEGAICDAAYLTPQGRMITDMRVAHTRERTLLDVPAPLAESLRARLDGLLFSEDAQIADLTGALHVLDVHGPAAPEAIESLGGRFLFFRDDPYGVPGYSAFLDEESMVKAIDSLRGHGVVETTLETLDVVRIEAGRPAFLVDMDEHTIPLEAGLETRAISFTKGCYVGQEIIVRVLHRGGGRVARRLVGFRFEDGGPLPERGDMVLAGTREVGTLTSVARSPALELPIALGYVHRDFTQPGTELEVVGTAGRQRATVTALPFVARG
jgi:folate-binding protein YgfZ